MKIWRQFWGVIRQYWGIFIAIIIFTAIMLLLINHASIWYDEAFSVALARHNFGEIFYLTGLDVHPPMYYWLLKIWSIPFGHSVIAMRALSALFAVIALILAHILIKRLFSNRAANWTVILLAVSPLFIRYAVEVRMYSLTIVLGLIGTLLFLKTLKDKRWRYYIAYGFVAAFAMWTHYMTAGIWVAHAIYRAIYLYRNQQNKSLWTLIKAYFSLKWTLAVAGAMLLFAPWVPQLINQLRHVAQGYWPPALGFNSFNELVSDSLLYLEPYRTSGKWVLLVMALLAGLGFLLHRIYSARNTKTEQRGLTFLAIMFVVPILFVAVVSLPPLSSVFINRYMMFSISIGYIIMALAVYLGYYEKLASRGMVVFIGILLAACLLRGDYNVWYHGNYNKNAPINAEKEILGKHAMAAINNLDKDHTPVLANAFIGFSLVNYASDKHPVYVEDDRSFVALYLLDNQKVKDIDALAKRSGRFWVVNDIGGFNEAFKDAAKKGAWKEIKSVSVRARVSGITYNKAAIMYEYGK